MDVGSRLVHTFAESRATRPFLELPATLAEAFLAALAATLQGTQDNFNPAAKLGPKPHQ